MMARRSALPGGALDKLMDEVKPSKPKLGTPRRAARSAPKRSASSSRPIRGEARMVTRPKLELGDPVVRYAASRGLMPATGPMESVRLAMQLAMDVRDLARRERVGVFTVVTRALAGYLHERD